MSKKINVNQTLARAKSQEKKGNAHKATELYALVLSQFPNNRSAQIALTRLTDKTKENTTTIDQQEIDQLVNLYSSGDFDKTLEKANIILETTGPSAHLHNIIGVVLKAKNQDTESITHYRKAIDLNPNYAEAHNNLGNALKDAKQLNEAIQCFERSIQLNPKNALPYSNLGDALRIDKKTKRAIDVCLQAVVIDPQYAKAYFHLGNAYLDEKNFLSAQQSYQKSLEINPSYAEAHNNLGLALSKQEKNSSAKKHLLKAIELKPSYADAHYNYGNLLSKQGDQKTAITHYEQAIEIKPGDYQSLNALGNSLRSIGESKDAQVCFAQALEINPNYAPAIYNRISSEKYKGNHQYLFKLQQLLSDSNTSDRDRIFLCFSLSKAYEDINDKDSCIRYLHQGNKLESNTIEYHIANDKALVNNIKTIFKADSRVYSYSLEDSKPSQKPIFIVGMPRSGTTLTEQIIASHSSVYGAGELNILGGYVSPLMRSYLKQDTSNRTVFSEETINSVRTHYMKGISDINAVEDIITDKMPTNFLWIGFILSALPEAKIVHLDRNPTATCWSIYKRLFTSAGNRYAYDLETLGEFYILYRDLMQFWKDQFPGRIYDVEYEKLTQNQEEETRKLLAFCELEWEPQCLDFHKTQRAVKTASVDQVRKKMYTGSSEAWKDYEPYLAPLIDRISDKN